MAENDSSRLAESLLSGGIATAIGAFVTVLVWLVMPTPWTLTQVLIAVLCASFFAGYFGRYFATPIADRS